MVIRAAIPIPTQPVEPVNMPLPPTPLFEVKLDGTALPPTTPPVEVALTPPSPPPPLPQPAVPIKTVDELLTMKPHIRRDYYKSLNPEVKKKLKHDVKVFSNMKTWASKSPEEREKAMKHLDEMRARRWKQLPPIDSNEDKGADGSPIQPS